MYVFIFREKGKEGEREKERKSNISVWLLLMLPILETQACALTGIRTNDPLVGRLALNPLSHNSRAKFIILMPKENSNDSLQ